jgi:hypothetical protein
MGIFTPKKKHGQAFHQSQAKIGVFEILLKLGYFLQDVPKKNAIPCRFPLKQFDILRHSHFFVGLVKPILVIHGAIVVKRYDFVPGHFFHVVEVPFGIGRPILNGLFDDHRSLWLKKVIQECLSGYPGYSWDFLQIHGLNRFDFQR